MTHLTIEFMIELLRAVEEKDSSDEEIETTVRCRFQDYDEKIAVTRGF